MPEVHVQDPKISIACGNKVLSLKRGTGGRAIFEFYIMDIVTGPRDWKFREISKEETFDALCKFLFGGE